MKVIEIKAKQQCHTLTLALPEDLPDLQVPGVHAWCWWRRRVCAHSKMNTVPERVASVVVYVIF